MSGDTAAKFHRFSAAYVAVGGSPKWEEISRNGTEIWAGSLYHAY